MSDAPKSSPASEPSGVTPSIREQALAWLERFAENVREHRYEDARTQFAQGVIGFGTVALRAVDLPALERLQWREIWENSTGFRFETSEVRVFGSDKLVGIAVTWSSVGYDAAGAPFQRPGRATILLSPQGDQWLAVHTHFSLAPGVPEKSYAPSPRAMD